MPCEVTAAVAVASTTTSPQPGGYSMGFATHLQKSSHFHGLLIRKQPNGAKRRPLPHLSWKRVWGSQRAVCHVLSNDSPSQPGLLTPPEAHPGWGAHLRPLHCPPVEAGTNEDTRLPASHCSHTSLLCFSRVKFSPATGPLHMLFPLLEWSPHLSQLSLLVNVIL